MINGTERILVCCSKTCTANGAQQVADAIEEELIKRGYCDDISVRLVRTGCIGECDQGPIVRLMPRDVTYYRVGAKHAASIVDSLDGEPVKKLLFKKKRVHFEKLSENPFFGLQHRASLRHVGVIDPLSIEDYIAHGGYAGLKKARTISPNDIFSMLQKCGLHIKRADATTSELSWHEAASLDVQQIFCFVNTGGFDDPVGLALAEGLPHGIIEGMAIALRATKATKGVFYLKSENSSARSLLQNAVADARAAGMLDLTADELAIEIDTAIPAEDAHEQQTDPRNDEMAAETNLLIGAETLASIPFALNEGPDYYQRASINNSKGTKAFSLGGKAKHIGLVEVQMGTSLRTLIFKIGGGVAGDRPLKAVRIGGSTGIYLSEPTIDLSVDFDSFAARGIPMDVGSIDVLDDRTCIVKTMHSGLKRLLIQNPTRSANFDQCLRKAISILERMGNGSSEASDVNALEEIGPLMKDAASGSGELMSANSLLSSIEHFRHEYEAHALEQRCPAGACPKLTRFFISPEACAGCDACSDACPASAISGNQREPHIIDYETCISCGTCRDVCRFHAVLTERRKSS